MALLQEELLKHPKVQASLRVAGEKALNDPGVQSALLTAAKESGDEVLAIVRNQVTSWAQDPQAQARAKEIARQAAAGAGQALGQAGQMLADQIAQGPAGLRFLAFAAAGTSLAVCVLEFLSVESVFTGPARWVISGFQGIFAVTTMLFEMPADWVAMVPGVTHYQDLIIDEAKFMTRAGGRGLFYIFQGAIWACFASLVKLVHLVAAVAMLLVGTLHVLMQLLGAQTWVGDTEVETIFSNLAVFSVS
ncbi:mas [Symbiodinium sp. CCMP2456]|nr:mas [Symbiodinium sp. CCMP2456]